METTTIPTTQNGKPMYVIVKDGHGMEHKIVNFDNPEMVPNKGIKIVKAFKKSSRHQPASSMRVAREASTGIVYGIVAGVHEKSKELRFRLIEINDMRQFDLAVLQDRMEWAVISRAPFLKGSPFAQGKPSHELYDVEAEANIKIEAINNKEEAYKIMRGLSEMQTIDMARNVGGIDTRNNSLVVIKGELFDFIDSKEKDKGAKKFNEIWTMSNREAHTVFKRCQHVGLISFDITNGFLWKKATPLGSTEPMAIEYITKNSSMLMTMDNESKSMDDKWKSMATPEEKEKNFGSFPVNKAVDNNILKELEEDKARVKEKEAELDRILAKARQVESVDVTKEGLVSKENTEVNKEAAELRTLQEKARKHHGMVQAFTVKDPKKIQEWIDSHPSTSAEQQQ